MKKQSLFEKIVYLVSERVKDAILPSQVVMPFAYLAGPILACMKKPRRNAE